MIFLGFSSGRASAITPWHDPIADDLPLSPDTERILLDRLDERGDLYVFDQPQLREMPEALLRSGHLITVVRSAAVSAGIAKALDAAIDHFELNDRPRSMAIAISAARMWAKATALNDFHNFRRSSAA